MTIEPVRTIDRRLDVESVSRVEGEGRLHVRVRGREVLEARLDIVEAPRFFERLVVGRRPDEVIDIMARICGICPVAYQLTAAMAFESLVGVQLDPAVERLRRLLYHGEWLQSHALHVTLLHAPDFLGFPDAIAMAREHRDVVERGLRLKHAGVRILEVLGGRSVHPVSVRVGGFHRVPSMEQLGALRPELEAALEDALVMADWVAGLPFSGWGSEPALLALVDPAGYPLMTGRIRSSEGVDLAPGDWETGFTEEQRDGSTALVSRGRDGRHHLLGPAARVGLAASRLHPLAAAALMRAGGPELVVHDRSRSIVARAVEMIHAVARALELLDGLERPDRPWEPWTPLGGRAAWSTEAPRGLLFHRYDLDDEGLVTAATIVPPTSQNQAAIEDDLHHLLPAVLDLPDAEATARLEALIRCYDPCISCATHFLTLDVDRVP